VMRRSARLDADQAGRDRGEELCHVVAPQPAAQDGSTVRADGVDLKDVLGDVDADRANLDHGWPSVVALLMNRHFWHNSMPLRGPSTPSFIGRYSLMLARLKRSECAR